MPLETLEKKALSVESILKDFEKALRSKNPEGAIDKLRGAVSRAEYDGNLCQYELVNLASRTQELVEKYRKKQYSRQN
ncbi:MAG: hypothetical protein KKE23_02490 [Nanoarchaeota archaeon]|nr:hypothetical protein [Nanoarchaeota archaeon]